MKKILIVEDDETLNRGIAIALKRENYQFTSCFTLEQAKTACRKEAFDLIVLDIELPDGSGLEFCQRLRRTGRVPIILLTARDMEVDIVSGLESGADDYITKPFSLMVLRARIHALLRRTESQRKGMTYETEDYFFDFAKMEFYRDKKAVDLSKTEQKLLYLLTHHADTPLSREMLMAEIWQSGTEYVEDNALSVAVRRLRDKLEDEPAKPAHIKTVYGKGYVWLTDGKTQP